ncbi:dihydroxyacetone kinase subunit DhaK, partial [uncultured Fusobacterium sp.]|uniref:dihydroxyacetone kinase subunit DhaK n=1 Tax=uncultured Fusobacterium sp. TaxID=159267 RepID=UPI0025934E4C
KDEIEKIYDKTDEKRDYKVAVLVNGLGETTLIELFIINNRLQDLLREKEVTVVKTLVGNYMTSLDMGGFSISIVKLDQETKQLLFAEQDTIAF